MVWFSQGKTGSSTARPTNRPTTSPQVNNTNKKARTPFLRFTGQFYEHTDDVATGSPLSLVMATFFTEESEETTLKEETHKPLCWFRCVDDTNVIRPHGPGKLSEFLDHMNTDHGKIQLTMETEGDCLPSFLL
jgi:hypothetical protein